MRRRSKPKQKSRQNRARAERDQQLEAQTLSQLADQLSVGFTFRFVATSNFTGSLTVTYQNLLDSWLIAGQATAGYQLFDFVKIKRVIIRSTVQIGGAGANQTPSCTVGVEFPGLVAGGQASGKQKSCTSMSPFVPAIVDLAPGKDTANGMYQPSNGDVAFVVRATDQAGSGLIGTIVDVVVSLKNSADVSPAAVASAISGATAGNLYFGGIDGGRLAATAMRSVFVPRI